MESQAGEIQSLLEKRAERRRQLKAEKDKTQQIIKEKIQTPRTKTQINNRYMKGVKKAMPPVKFPVSSRKDVDTISMGYDRFCDTLLPPDTWKYLPHTFASVVSDKLWVPFDYLVMLSNIIATVIARGGGRILVSLPPRHGKSFFISQWLPTWFLSMWPNKRVLLTTYEANFAATWGRRVRNIVKEKGSMIGISLAEDSTASNNWATTHEGGMVTAGVGGPITGKGCVTGDTVIYTNVGTMTIEKYFRNYSLQDNIYVLTYQESDDSVIFNKIIARRELTAHEIYTIDGNLKLTGNHPIYDKEQGYRPTRDLRPGSPVLSIKKQTSRGLRNLWATQTRDRFEMPKVLHGHETTEQHNNIDVFDVREGIQEKGQSTQDRRQGWLQKFLLLCDMQSVFNNSTIHLPYLRQTIKETITTFLQSGMQTRSDCRGKKKTKDVDNETMPDMFNPISTTFAPYKILFKYLRRCCSFATDVRKGKLQLQRRNQLREGLPGTKTINSGARWSRLCDLWVKGRNSACQNRTRQEQPDRSSFRCQHQEQCTRKSCDLMRDLPCNTSPLFCDTIQTITRDCSTQHVVYDIEVEGTHNYFANQKTLKNCDLGIIDDPHKNWQEAQSETTRNMIQDWFDSTFYTRLEPGATIVVLHTRWHENDLIGYLLREKTEDGWFHIRIPAIAEDYNGEADILGRPEGAALCPQRYDEKALLRIKANMSTMIWNALFQQRPAPMEGTIFLRKDWKYYTVMPKINFVLQSWDTASKKNKHSAFSVCQTWGISDQGAVLIDQWRERVEFPQLLQQAKAQFMKHKPNVVLIEDRDSGQALIQTLKQDSTLMMPIIPIYPDMDKLIRAQAVSPMFESGRIYVPAITPDTLWVEELITNCATFPNALFKDEIDSMSQALAYIMTMAIGGRILGSERRKTSKLLDGYRRLM